MERELNYMGLFNDSFERAVRPHEHEFYDAFYRRFLQMSEEIGSLFSATDLDRQERVLHESMLLMVAFFATKIASPKLQQIARRHGPGDLNIRDDLYDLWLRALVDTVAQYDSEFDNDIALAWRIVLAPGIAFMQGFGRSVAST
jgi:hemoglobin-like flavoprotein